jgi:hypothetical protein
VKSREERLVENELLFRQVNERIAELSDDWDGELEIVCECANERCTRVISVPADEYERVRRQPDRFIVLGGHQVAKIENVVESTERYLVVEKHPEVLHEAEAAFAREDDQDT